MYIDQPLTICWMNGWLQCYSGSRGYLPHRSRTQSRHKRLTSDSTYIHLAPLYTSSHSPHQSPRHQQRVQYAPDMSPQCKHHDVRAHSETTQVHSARTHTVRAPVLPTGPGNSHTIDDRSQKFKISQKHLRNSR